MSPEFFFSRITVLKQLPIMNTGCRAWATVPFALESHTGLPGIQSAQNTKDGKVVLLDD